jgi:hypothetical protein
LNEFNWLSSAFLSAALNGVASNASRFGLPASTHAVYQKSATRLAEFISWSFIVGFKASP